MTFFTTIAFFAAAQGLFLGLVLLYLRRGHIRSNQYLGSLIIFYSLWTAEFAAYFTAHFYEFPHLLYLTLNVPLLFGPLLYFYAESLNFKKQTVFWILLHFIPFAIFISMQFPFFIKPATDKIEALQTLRNLENPPAYSLEFFLREVFKSLHLILYIWFSLRIYLNWTQSVESYRENKIRRRWLLILIIGLSLYAIFDVAHFLSLYFFSYDYLFLIAKGVLLTGAGIIYYLGYLTIRRSLPHGQSSTPSVSLPKIKYAKSGLTRAQAKEFHEKIIQTMDVQRPYLDPNLSLQTLASVVGVSPHHLSQILNTQLGKSFSEFVTEYRIATAKEKLSNPSNQHFTILSIAYDSGFKTKESFNSAFKKLTGITPSTFRANQSQPMDPM